MAEQKEALKANPGFANADIELARLSIMAGQYADAVGFAQEAIRITPGQAEAYFLLARAHHDSGKPDAAEAPIQTLRKSFPDDPAVQAEVGRWQLAKGDLASARASFEHALARNPAEVGALQGLIIIDVRQKNGAAARKRIETALAAQPNNHAFQVLAGRTYLAIEDTASAERVLKQTVSADANNIEAYGLLATVYVQQNKLPEATAEFQKLASLQPKSLTYQTMVGMLLYMQGKLDEAKAAYDKVLAIDPKAAAAANNLAQIYVDRNQSLDTALQLAQTAKAGLPDSHEVDDTLGWIYYKKGVGTSAVSYLKKAVSADPANAVYLYHLGAAYALNKDRVNARQTLEKALKLQPTFPGSDDARKILDSLKG
jgi:tetratricopeptide (TPR) repeat protein